jgi:excisionase family DNA binding protein
VANLSVSLLSVRQVAEKLGVTQACIRRWVLLRKIATVRLGRLVRVPSSEVERLVNEGTCPACRTR